VRIVEEALAAVELQPTAGYDVTPQLKSIAHICAFRGKESRYVGVVAYCEFDIHTEGTEGTLYIPRRVIYISVNQWPGPFEKDSPLLVRCFLAYI
jgi:hypothetical protein